MTKALTVLAVALIVASCGKQEKPATETTAPAMPAVEKVMKPAPPVPAGVTTATHEVGCGKCIFGANERGCKTWVKVEGNTYPLINSGINAHNDGLCGSSGEAQLAGEIVEGKYVATYGHLTKLNK